MAKAPVTPEEKTAHEEWKRKSAEEYLRARGRAISTEEKREVVERLFRVWEKFPDLRLCQLIANTMSVDNKKMESFFYVEDKMLADAVEEFDKKQNK